MASTNFKLFDENKVNMMSDTEYNIASQRLNGVQTGIASSQLQNKTLYQTSLMSYALAQLMNANGIDANDTAAVSAFVNGLSDTLVQKVLDKATEQMAIAATDNSHYMTPALVKKEIGSLDPFGNWNYCCHVDSTTEPAEFTTINSVNLLSINEFFLKINSGIVRMTSSGGDSAGLTLKFVAEDSSTFDFTFYPGITNDRNINISIKDFKTVIRRIVVCGATSNNQSQRIFYNDFFYNGSGVPSYHTTYLAGNNKIFQNPVLTGAKCYASHNFSSIDADIYYR